MDVEVTKEVAGMEEDQQARAHLPWAAPLPARKNGASAPLQQRHSHALDPAGAQTHEVTHPH